MSRHDDLSPEALGRLMDSPYGPAIKRAIERAMKRLEDRIVSDLVETSGRDEPDPKPKFMGTLDDVRLYALDGIPQDHWIVIPKEDLDYWREMGWLDD